MLDCQCEQSSLHHLGDGAGHGLVRSDEKLVLAVFSSSKTSLGQPISMACLPTSALNKNDLSVARLSYTDAGAMLQFVVGDDAADKLVGVAVADTEAVRAIPYIVRGLSPPKSGRGACVVDKVELHDHDGHAAIGYAESQATLTPNQKSQVREAIRNDLIDAFGVVMEFSAIFGSDDAIV